MLFIALLLAWVPIAFASIAVLEFELNDLTLPENARDTQYHANPPNAAEIARTASLAALLRNTLHTQHSLDIVPVSPKRYLDADKGFGYLFSHPNKAAELGQSVDAEWVAVSRLHKPSFLFAYLITHLVHVPTGQQMPEIIVEIKGQQQALNERGIKALAKQIRQAMQNHENGKS